MAVTKTKTGVKRKAIYMHIHRGVSIGLIDTPSYTQGSNATSEISKTGIGLNGSLKHTWSLAQVDSIVFAILKAIAVLRRYSIFANKLTNLKTRKAGRRFYIPGLR